MEASFRPPVDLVVVVVVNVDIDRDGNVNLAAVR
jgi:hypothetical protein